jgi:CRISPR-associated endonuclease Cas2
MADREWLYVFTYDVSKNHDRRRVAARLERELVRVQYSVFEGPLTHIQAKRLAEACARFLGVDDSLRVYAISAAGHGRSLVYGAGQLPEREGFYLL